MELRGTAVCWVCGLRWKLVCDERELRDMGCWGCEGIMNWGKEIVVLRQ